MQWNEGQGVANRSHVKRLGLDVVRNLRLPFVAVLQKLLLVVEELLRSTRLGFSLLQTLNSKP